MGAAGASTVIVSGRKKREREQIMPLSRKKTPLCQGGFCAVLRSSVNTETVLTGKFFCWCMEMYCSPLFCLHSPVDFDEIATFYPLSLCTFSQIIATLASAVIRLVDFCAQLEATKPVQRANVALPFPPSIITPYIIFPRPSSLSFFLSCSPFSFRQVTLLHMLLRFCIAR